MATTLGYNQAPHTTAKARRATAQASETCVLVVEDHEDTRFMLRTMLELRGLSVVEAANGELAIEMAESVQPDIILIDSQLPLLDGFEATRRIRKLISAREIPIVFISGQGLPDTEARAFAAGCSDYLVKPFAFREMDRVLQRHLWQDKVN